MENQQFITPGTPIRASKQPNAINITRSCLAGLFMGKEGNNHLKSITCQVFLIFSNLSSPRGGVLLIHYPRGPFQSPKVTKNATKIIRSCLAGLFIGNEGNNHLKSITCSVLLIFPTSFPSWGDISPIHHPGLFFSAPKWPKMPSR